MKKFVLDTNVIMTDPKCIYKFEENDVYVPLIVIEELDNHKKGHSDIAKNSRQFARQLDELRAEGSLASGVELPTGGKLFVINTMKGEDSDLGLNLEINDDLIIFTAAKVGATLISQDLNVRIKADAVGVKSEDYKAGKVELKDSLDSGHSYLGIFTAQEMDEFRETGFMKYKEGKHPNEYYILHEEDNPRNSALGRYAPNEGGIVGVRNINTGAFGITGKNAEQRFAIDALTNPDIHLVSLVGKAGTGKTLLAVASALASTIEQKDYKKMLISRPVIPMGKDLGYLPGTLEEKMNPWMAPIFDNLDFLFGESGGQKEWKPLVENGVIKIEALTYIRGRSIPNQYLIVDEAQNLSPHEVKTIITRAGEGTKIILTGDPDQIDNQYLDEVNNGLTYVIDRMKDQDIVAHVELTKGERSKLAEAGTKLL